MSPDFTAQTERQKIPVIQASPLVGMDILKASWPMALMVHLET
jgi:hypothetical protein